MTASIPTHRLHVHVRRLVAKGFKVLINQMRSFNFKSVMEKSKKRENLSYIYTEI